MDEMKDSRKPLDSLVPSTSDKQLWKQPLTRHLPLLKAVRNIWIKTTQVARAEFGKVKYIHIKDEEESRLSIYDRPLPCFGCGVGWFSFLLGFACPLLWYYATILYFGNYYRRDPRERAGLAASAIAAMVCSVGLLIVLAFVLLGRSSNSLSLS